MWSLRRGLGTLGVGVLVSTFGAVVLVACGDTVIIEQPATGGSSVLPPDTGGAGGQGGAGLAPITGGSPGQGGSNLTPIDDPGCPNQPPPLEAFECDPYQPNASGCGFGEGCYIYVQYPNTPCGQEIYGAVCLPAGSGQQGDPCGGAQSCGSGLVCVVTGAGTQCVELCPLEGDDGCPPGLICEPIDVQGFGGCL